MDLCKWTSIDKTRDSNPRGMRCIVMHLATSPSKLLRFLGILYLGCHKPWTYVPINALICRAWYIALDYIGTLIMHACKSCKSVLSWVPAWNAQRPVTKLLAKCTHRMDTVLFSTYLVCQLAFYKCESQQSAILYIEKIDPSNKWSIQQLSRKPHWEKLPGLILL